MYKNNKIAVVVPAYNEERLIGKTISTMPSYVDKIIVIDDASSDATYRVAGSFTENLGSKLIVIRHRTNQGCGGAIVTGYRRALAENADIIAVMAGDAQMDPEHLYKLLDPIVEGNADYTKGNRLFSKKIDKMPHRRRRGNALLTLLTKIASGYWDVIDPQNGYTATSRMVLETIDLEKIHKRYGYCNDILVKLNIFNFRIMDVVMPPVYGDEKSGINIRTYTFKMSWLLTKDFFYRISKKFGGLRFHPLILFYFSGLLLFVVGFTLGLNILFFRFTGRYITEGTMILTSLLLIIGIQLILFALLFDMLSSRYGTQKEVGKTPAQLKRFHPTIVGLIRRISRKYWGSGFHPIALIYGLGIVLSGLGFLLGVYVVYYRIIHGTYTVGSVVLTTLLLIIGLQSIFFGMIFEMESKNRREW